MGNPIAVNVAQIRKIIYTSYCNFEVCHHRRVVKIIRTSQMVLCISSQHNWN